MRLKTGLFIVLYIISNIWNVAFAKFCIWRWAAVWQVGPEAYFWRDYYGAIPHDALKAGMDKNGRPMFVGQAIHIGRPNEIWFTPGKIYENNAEIEFEVMGYSSTVNTAMKILCTHYPERFKWLHVHKDQVLDLLKKYMFLVAGLEVNDPNTLVHVARCPINGELSVGKHVCWPAGHLSHVMRTVYKGKAYNCTEFELLWYDASENTSYPINSKRYFRINQVMEVTRNSACPSYISLTLMLIVYIVYCSFI